MAILCQSPSPSLEIMTFRVPKIHSCCCCSLATASKIIGCLHLLLVAAAFTLGFWLTPRYIPTALYESPILDMLVFTSVMVYGSFKLMILVSVALDVELVPHYAQRVLYESPLLDMLVFSSMMLYGSFKQNHHLMFPWILLQTAFLVFIALSCFSHAAYMGLMDYDSEEMPFEFIGIVVQSWSILVVYNFYRELKEQQQETA